MWEADAPQEDIIFANNRAIWADAIRGSLLRATADNALKLSEEKLGREHPETVYAADTWAQLHWGNRRAMALLRENLEIQRRRFGTDHQLALRGHPTGHGLSHGQTDADLAEAESLARESCERWVRKFGPEFPETLTALAQRGEILATRGKLEEARSVLRPLPDAYARVLGPDHIQRSTVLQNYGLVLEATGDLDGARRSTGSRSRSTRRGSPGGPTAASSRPCCTPASPASSWPPAAMPPP